MDADALMVEVDRLAGELRAEAERLIGTEGKDAAITRLRAEAKADEKLAFQRMNLAGSTGSTGTTVSGARARPLTRSTSRG